MKRDWWYVVIVIKGSYLFITVSDDPDLEWDSVVGEFWHYHDARDFCEWLIDMRDR